MPRVVEVPPSAVTATRRSTDHGVRDGRSSTQKSLQSFCESGPVTALVMLMVVIAVLAIATDVSSPAFDFFCTIFFVVEVAIRMYALTPTVFFQ